MGYRYIRIIELNYLIWGGFSSNDFLIFFIGTGEISFKVVVCFFENFCHH